MGVSLLDGILYRRRPVDLISFCLFPIPAQSRMSHSIPRNAVVLVIDRLGANMLGAYGSTWFETHNFNRLAARSLVFDQAITRTTDIAAAYQGLLEPVPGDNLLKRIGDAGISSILLTDEPKLSSLSASAGFDRIVPIESISSGGVAPTLDQTELASFFAQAMQEMTELGEGNCLWLHSRGLSGSWDAPAALRTRLADPEDPPPPQFFEPPARMFDSRTDDPDELLGYQQVCAAQVTMIDDFLGVILDMLDAEMGQSTLFCLLSTRGFPLGEHGLVGQSQPEGFVSCYSESVHVPMMICLPTRPEFKFARSIRLGSLVQPNWLSGFLNEWFDSPDSVQQTVDRMSRSLPNKRLEAAVTICGDATALQTHAWKLNRDSSRNELYAKPDDRGEVNDVSRRCPQIVDSLSLILDQWTTNRQVEIPGDFELAEELAIRTD